MAEPRLGILSSKIENMQQVDENSPHFGFGVSDSNNQGRMQSPNGRGRNIQYQGTGDYSSENVDTNFHMDMDNPQSSGSENMTPDIIGSPEIQIHSEGMPMSSVSQGSVHSPSNEHVVQPIIQVTGVNDDTQVGLQLSFSHRLHFKRLCPVYKCITTPPPTPKKKKKVSYVYCLDRSWTEMIRISKKRSNS